MLFLPSESIVRFSGTHHPNKQPFIFRLVFVLCVCVYLCGEHSLRPLRLAIFSMQFVDRDSFL